MHGSGCIFKFIEELNPEAYISAYKLEQSVFDDPQVACISGRQTLESIINDVIEREEITYFSKLFDKIIHLDKHGYFTKIVKSNMDTIRSFGNKAAHEPAFDDLESAIKVYKATYEVCKWYAEVYSFNLKIPEYRNPLPIKTTSINDDDLVEKVLEKLRNQKQEDIDKNDYSGEPKLQTDEKLINYELKDNQSYLLKELKKLQESSQEAVESPEEFSKLKGYMHIDRKIQKDLELILEQEKTKQGPSLILLSGSVGDGKSHLLSYLRKNENELLSDYRLYNDATESFDPKKSAIQTLSEELEGFSDQMIDQSNDRIIIAINLGILNNFLEADHGDKTFNKLKGFIQESKIFESNITGKYCEGFFNIISFSDYQPFELSKEGPRSSFFESAFSKIFSDHQQNPFYQAYKKDAERGIDWVVHQNYKFLMNESVQQHIVRLLINNLIKHKLVISARALFNFIADIVIPEGYVEGDELQWGPFEKINCTTPSLLFKRKDRSYILKSMVNLDPIGYRSKRVDEILIDLNTLEDWGSVVKELIAEPVSYKWMMQFIDLKKDLKVTGESFTYSSEQEFFQAVVRTAFLTSKELNKEVSVSSFDNYISYLYAFNKKDLTQIQELYEKVKGSIFKWKGSPKRNYIYLNDWGKFKVAQMLNLKPYVEHLDYQEEDLLYNFSTTLTVGFHGGKSPEKVMLNVDFYLYSLIEMILGGYCPNKKDEEDAIQFVEFLDKIMSYGNYKEELLVHIPDEEKMYRLEKNEFSGFTFERE
ncbi:DNA phosphorothioation-dependent restriction protein DptF [Halobacillus faecis]